MSAPVLVTGAAGFIGAAVVERLLQQGQVVVGIDNLNSYYDPALKQAGCSAWSSTVPLRPGVFSSLMWPMQALWPICLRPAVPVRWFI